MIGTLLRTWSVLPYEILSTPGEWASLGPILKTEKLRYRELMATRNQLYGSSTCGLNGGLLNCIVAGGCIVQPIALPGNATFLLSKQVH